MDIPFQSNRWDEKMAIGLIFNEYGRLNPSSVLKTYLCLFRTAFPLKI